MQINLNWLKIDLIEKKVHNSYRSNQADIQNKATLLTLELEKQG